MVGRRGLGGRGGRRGGPVVALVLSVLQPGDEPLVLVAELPAHQRRLADHHHVLEQVCAYAGAVTAGSGGASA